MSEWIFLKIPTQIKKRTGYLLTIRHFKCNNTTGERKCMRKDIIQYKIRVLEGWNRAMLFYIKEISRQRVLKEIKRNISL